MAIYSFPSESGGGTDFSLYHPLTANTSKLFAVNNVYENILSITGKGYLSGFIFTTGGSVVITVNFTVDGVSKGEFTCSSTTNRSGIIVVSDARFIPDKTTADAVYISSKFSAGIPIALSNILPFGTGGNNAVVLLPFPLFFKTSLLIQGKADNTATAGMYYQYECGVI